MSTDLHRIEIPSVLRRTGAGLVAKRGARLAALALCGLVGPGAALAQRAACSTTELPDPPRQVLRCPNGLTVTAEAGAELRLVDRDGDGIPETVVLDRGGVLVEVPPGVGRRGVSVRTPQAVASVRGTVWATDVAGSRTSVLVERGVVAVRRLAGASGGRAGTGPSALLRAGERVDVDEGSTDRLTVRRWPEARRAALLARLGR